MSIVLEQQPEKEPKKPEKKITTGQLTLNIFGSLRLGPEIMVCQGFPSELLVMTPLHIRDQNIKCIMHSISGMFSFVNT